MSGIIFMILCCLVFSEGHSQTVSAKKNSEYWFGFMENYFATSVQHALLEVQISSDVNTYGTISVPKMGWSKDFSLTANVAQNIALPSLLVEHLLSEVKEQRGIYVQSNDPVRLVAINHNSAKSTDATPVLPVSQLGASYMVTSYAGLDDLIRIYPSEFVIVATEDNTVIDITPSVATKAGKPAGGTFQVTLDRGESYQVQAQGVLDLTGTTVVGADVSGTCRPFALFSGVSCAKIPGSYGCDHIFEQNLPLSYWGKSFFALPYKKANKFTLRVLAAEDATSISVNGGPSFVLNKGQYWERNALTSAQCVEADKAVSVLKYMESKLALDNGVYGFGDPVLSVVMPADELINEAVFVTADDLGMSHHFVNVLVPAGSERNLLLDKNVVPIADFQIFQACPGYSYVQIDLLPGVHSLFCPGGFMAEVYGMASGSSYAYNLTEQTAYSDNNNLLSRISIDSTYCATSVIDLKVDPSYANPFWMRYSNQLDTIAFVHNLSVAPSANSDIYIAGGTDPLSGCELKKYYSVESPVSPLLDVTQSDNNICRYEPVRLQVSTTPANSIYTYKWSPEESLNSATISNPIATPSRSTTYTVTVSTLSGCGSATGNVEVKVGSGNIHLFEAEADNEKFCLGGSSKLKINVESLELEDNFDPGISWGLWESISNGVASPVCGSSSGNALYFNGDGVRSATTLPQDVSAGGTVVFDIKVASGTFPCDDVDSGEDIILEYQNGVGPWMLMDVMYEFAYSKLTRISVAIPSGAKGPSTRFRWQQIAHSGNNQDNWIIDDVVIAVSNAGGYSYVWSPAYGLSATNIANPLASPGNTTLYSVAMTDASTGCVYTDSLLIEVGQPFDLDVFPDSALCSADPVLLYASPSVAGNYDFHWTEDGLEMDNGFYETPLVNPKGPVQYKVEVTSSLGCKEQEQLSLSVVDYLSLTLTSSHTEVCSGDSMNLYAVLDGNLEGAEYLWSPSIGLNNPTLSNPLVLLDSAITYEVVVKDLKTQCLLSDQISVKTFPKHSLSLPVDQVLCDARGYILSPVTDAGPSVSWSWSPQNLLSDPYAQSPVIMTNQSSTFEVSMTDGNACIWRDSIRVDVAFEGLDINDTATACEGDSLWLSSGLDAAIYTHLWSDGSNSDSLLVLSTDQVIVEIQSPEACIYRDTIVVAFFDLPILNLPDQSSMCEGELLLLDAANPGSTFQWFKGAIELGDTQQYEVSESGTYKVLVLSPEGCAQTDSSTVTFHALPWVYLPADTAMCVGSNVIFDVESPGCNYLWTTGESTAWIRVFDAGSYGVSVTNSDNCSADFQAELRVLEYPKVNLGSDIPDACAGEEVILDAQNTGLSFDWSTGEMSQAIAVSESGEYSVSVDNGYCSSSDKITVLFNSIPLMPSGLDTATCFSEVASLVLRVDNPDDAILWDGMQTSDSLIVYAPGSYGVLITNPIGCELYAVFEVEEVCSGGNLYVPNAFTPDDDGVNDIFLASGENIEIFKMEIWNRWGERVFYSNRMDIGWDGRRDGQGDKVESGAYIYVIQYQFEDYDNPITNMKVITGHLSLLR